MKRRTFLQSLGIVLAHQAMAGSVRSVATSRKAPDYTLQIEPCTLEIGKGVHIRTVATTDKFQNL